MKRSAELPKYVYKRKGGLLYFEKRGLTCKRLHGDVGSAQFELEYQSALASAPLKVALGMRTPKGACHFLEMQRKAKARARNAGREYSLPDGWMRAQYEKQNGKCAISGLSMVKDREKHAPYAPSIDRKDSSKGYSVENCNLVAYIVNCAKNQFSESVLLEMCFAIASKRYKLQ